MSVCLSACVYERDRDTDDVGYLGEHNLLKSFLFSSYYRMECIRDFHNYTLCKSTFTFTYKLFNLTSYPVKCHSVVCMCIHCVYEKHVLCFLA